MKGERGVGGRRFIEAYKAGWPRWVLHAWIMRKLRGHFFRIQVQGLDRLRRVLDADPRGTLFLANHSSWWDLFLAHGLNESIPVDGYGMMEHFNLTRFRFFRRIGAFSVDRTDPLSVRGSIEYAAGLLQKPRSGVWIFPQGRIAGNDARPLRFQAGLRALVSRAGAARVVPVALRYEYWQEERPEAFVRFGEPVWTSRSERATILARLEQRLTEELDALRTDVVAQAADRFQVLLQGAGSVNERYARLCERMFGSVSKTT